MGSARNDLSLSAAASALLLLPLLACEGPAGPEGPRGPQGPEGPRGPEGNANVQSDTVTLTNSDWETGRIYFQTSSASSISRSARVATLDVPGLTEEIAGSGMVEVYLKTIEAFGSDASVWTALPYSAMSFTNEYTYNLAHTYDAGTITLYYYYEPNSPDVTAPDVSQAELPEYTFKYVLASADAASSVSSAEVSTDDHDALIRFLDRRFGDGGTR